MKRIIRTFCLIAAALLLSACAVKPAEISTEEKPVSVRRIEISHAPDKLKYEVGDTFDPTGTVIHAQMSDGTVVENVAYEYEIADPLTKSDTKVVFFYKGKKAEQMISVLSKGNNAMYAVENTETLPDNPLKGKTFLFLGSSVTAGAGSGGESMADYIAKRNGAICIKKAVSGTTLADLDAGKGDSYVKRFNDLLESAECPQELDAFFCQLSTNDKGHPESFGAVTAANVRDADVFDTKTTYGAIEYIVAKARERWNCPILFYTNPPMDDVNYGEMVKTLFAIAEKWDITVIDLYNDADFNNITEEQRILYMADEIHPTKAGYREWWTPKFEETLLSLKKGN